MVLPLIPVALIATGTLTGGTGLLAGGNGARKMRQAKKMMEDAVAAHEAERRRTETAAEVTNQGLKEYGEQQQEALSATVVRMSDFIRRNQRQVDESLKILVDGIDVEVNACGRPSALTADPLAILTTLATAGSAGAGIAAGATTAVSTFGVASTGTAIGTLSGAAAESATMAALGGGSLAAGGGGIALGATALNFVTVGPALLVGGLILNSKGEKVVTEATRFAADVRIQQAEVAALRTAFHGIDSRMAELRAILTALVNRATAALVVLEATESEDEGGFDAQRHASQFQEAIGLTVAVRDVAATPIVDEEGTLNDQTKGITMKYKEYVDGKR